MFSQLDRRALEFHIKVLGWLFIAGHVIFLVAGLFIFTFMTGLGALLGEAETSALLSIIGTSLALLLSALALPGLISGYGLLTYRPWAPILSIVIAMLNMLNFPVGTALGIYAIWVLLQATDEGYFAPRRPLNRARRPLNGTRPFVHEM